VFANRKELNAIDVANRDITPEIAGRNRARVTGRGLQGEGRVIVGVLTVAMGNLVRQAGVNLVGKLRETRQRKSGT
jgi:hypothetical protein